MSTLKVLLIIILDNNMFMKINKYLAIVAALMLVFTLASRSLQAFSSSVGSDGAQDVIISNPPEDAKPGVSPLPTNQPSQDGNPGVSPSPTSPKSQDNSPGVVSNPGTNGDQDSFTPTAPTTAPVTPISTNVGGGGGGYSGSGSMISGGNASNSCTFLMSYMKLGWKNDPTEVSKLQAYLKNNEKLNVDVNGTYDTKTFEAVKAFQAKYLEITMGPWGVSTPSGMVYITTLKKINQLACNSPLVLSAEELATINAYKNSPSSVSANGAIGMTGSSASSAPTATQVAITGSVTGNPIDLTPSANTAAVVNTSIWARFWNFIKNLF
jgi:hypothetical protein